MKKAARAKAAELMDLRPSASLSRFGVRISGRVGERKGSRYGVRRLRMKQPAGKPRAVPVYVSGRQKHKTAYEGVRGKK